MTLPPLIPAKAGTQRFGRSSLEPVSTCMIQDACFAKKLGPRFRGDERK